MKNLKRISILTIVLLLFLTINTVKAVDTSKLEEYINEKNLNSNTMSSSEIITMYQDLSKSYSNEEISEMLDEYNSELQNNGISQDRINTVKKILESTDAETMNGILEDVNVEDIKQKLDNGASAEEILNDIQKNMSTKQKVTTVSKIALGNKIIKKFLIVWIIYTIYLILIRGLIYMKAKQHYFTTFIPIYRDIVLFRICGYSAWWVLLLLVPIIGWIIYGVLKIIMNFELSASFGKGVLFGIGIWLLKPIFETILVFSKKCKYIEFIDD